MPKGRCRGAHTLYLHPLDYCCWYFEMAKAYTQSSTVQQRISQASKGIKMKKYSNANSWVLQPNVWSERERLSRCFTLSLTNTMVAFVMDHFQPVSSLHTNKTLTLISLKIFPCRSIGQALPFDFSFIKPTTLRNKTEHVKGTTCPSPHSQCYVMLCSTHVHCTKSIYTFMGKQFIY